MTARAAVVGAGIGGLAAAAGLRRSGLEVTVHEQSPALAPLGAGLTLWPNGARALRALGLAELPGAALRGGGVRSFRDGAVLNALDEDALERRYGAPLVAVHRAELQSALLDLAGAPVRF